MNALATITEIEVTDSGTVPVGFLYCSVKNIGNTDARVNGHQLTPGQAKDYPFVGKGYQEIEYEPEGTTLTIMYII